MADQDRTTFEAAAYSGDGSARQRVTLPADQFDGVVNVPVMHQAVKTYLANQRQGTAATKIRKYVIGGNQKPWRQKGTGRARQGSTRAPHWVGGGTVFGPQPRSYRLAMPKQMRALARKSALNARAREDAIVIIEPLSFDAPKTSQMAALIERLGVDGQKVLVLTSEAKPNVFLSARNLPTVHVMPYREASTYHVLWSDVVVIESDALSGTTPVEGGEEQAAGSRQRAAGRTRKTAAAKDEKATKGTRAPKAAAKSAGTTRASARKAAAKGSAKGAAKSGAKRGSRKDKE
jgi:large subunit ribosomal protein L4